MKKSAGILLFKIEDGRMNVFLVHPGGPYWKAKDLGAWSIPKGEFTDEEDGLAAARREFQEETGTPIDGRFIALDPVKQPSGKVIYPWAVKGDFEPAGLSSNMFEMEWPPRSGRMLRFPEVDRAAWFDLAEARKRIQPGQAPILDELALRLRQGDDL